MKRLCLTLGAMLACAAPAFAADIVPAFGDEAVPSVETFLIENQAISAAPEHPLSADQKNKLSALRDQFDLDTAQPKAQLRVAQRQLRRAITADAVDKKAALDLQSKINTLRSSLANARLSMMLASSDIFTPEQRAEMKSRKHRWGGRGHGHGRHFRGGRGFGGPPITLESKSPDLAISAMPAQPGIVPEITAEPSDDQ